MNGLTKVSAAVGAIALFMLVLVWRQQVPSEQGPAPRAALASASPAPAGPLPTRMEAVDPVGGRSGLVTHAIDVARLNGFPPDASPGDTFDLWVAWNPPLVKGPNIQLLLKGVRLEKVAPPVTPDGPYVAFLVISRAQARDLLYATRYGALSLTQPAG